MAPGPTDEQIKNAHELDKIVYEYDEDKGAFRFDDNKILGIFRKVWTRCAMARKGVKNGKVTLRTEYEDYLREPKTRRVLSSILGDDGHEQNVSLLGTAICSPLWFIGQPCFDLSYKGKKGPVHGDLHANNVIIDAEDGVHLIDFAWAARNKHVLVDYVLMENSLRFLLFPHHVHPDRQFEADNVLLSFDGAQQLATVPWKCPLGDHYRRLGLVLKEIRTLAQPYLARGFPEYLAAQFLVLFGQISYPDYNQLMAARALGLIANQLYKERFGATN